MSRALRELFVTIHQRSLEAGRILTPEEMLELVSPEVLAKVVDGISRSTSRKKRAETEFTVTLGDGCEWVFRRGNSQGNRCPESSLILSLNGETYHLQYCKDCIKKVTARNTLYRNVSDSDALQEVVELYLKSNAKGRKKRSSKRESADTSRTSSARKPVVREVNSVMLSKGYCEIPSVRAYAKCLPDGGFLLLCKKDEEGKMRELTESERTHFSEITSFQVTTNSLEEYIEELREVLGEAQDVGDFLDSHASEDRLEAYEDF